MDLRKITITVAPLFVTCGLISLACVQNKLPSASAAPPAPAAASPAPRNVDQADVQNDGDDVKVIELAHAPEAVRASVAKLSAEKNVKKVTKETDEGVTVYEVEYTSEGKTRLAEISAQGDVFEINTELKPESLPELVARAIKAAYPKGVVREANSVQVFFYEVEVMDDRNKPHQMRVSATGEVLGNLEATEEEPPLPARRVQK